MEKLQGAKTNHRAGKELSQQKNNNRNAYPFTRFSSARVPARAGKEVAAVSDVPLVHVHHAASIARRLHALHRALVVVPLVPAAHAEAEARVLARVTHQVAQVGGPLARRRRVPSPLGVPFGISPHRRGPTLAARADLRLELGLELGLGVGVGVGLGLGVGVGVGIEQG